MKRAFAGLFVFVLAVASHPIRIHAQQRAVEIGTDAQLVHKRMSYESGGQTDDFSSTQLQLPTGLRAGFFISPRTSIEVKLALIYVDPSDRDSYRTLSLAAGPVLHFSPDITRAQPYVRPYLCVDHNSLGDDSSRLFFGGALGIKVPMTSHGAMRYELFLQHGAEKDEYPSETVFGLGAGFSVFFP